MIDIWREAREPLNADVKKLLRKDFWYLLQISCVLPDLSGDYKYFTMFLLIYYLFSYTGCTLMYSIAFMDLLNEPSLISESIHFYLVLLIGYSLFILGLLKIRKLLTEFYQCLHDGFSQYGEWGIVYEAKLRKKYKHIYWISLGTPALFTFLAGCVLPFSDFLDEKYGSETITGVKNGINFDLPVVIWYPFDSSHGLNYWIAFFFQVSGASINTCVIATVDVGFVNLMHHICIQLEILTAALKNIDDRVKICLNSGSVKAYEEIYEKCLIQTIEHHRNINKQFDNIQEVVGFVIFLAFTLGAIIIGMSGVDILMFGFTRVGTMLMFFMFCVAEVSNMAMLCWYGQLAYDLSENLHDTLYFTNWIMATKNINKLKLIMMSRTIQPLMLTGGSWNANMETLSAVLQTSYSYFNIVVAANQ